MALEFRLLIAMCAATTFVSVGFGQIPERDPNLEERGGEKIVDGGWNASWSPDANSVVYGKPKGEGIRVVNLKTGETNDLTEMGKDPIWSPDGKFIAYVTEPHYNEYRHETIMLVSPQGGEPRRLTGGTFPAWSNDGTSIIYYSQSQSQLLSMAIDGRQGKLVLASPPSWYCAVSPNGKYVAFSSLRSRQMEIKDIESGKTLGEWSIGPTRGILPAWSPDGNNVAFGGFNGERLGLWVYNLEANAAKPVAIGCYTRPVWSHDGTKLAFDYRPLDARIREIWKIETKVLDELKPFASYEEYVRNRILK